MFQGSMIALVTPMQDDGSIDKKALSKLVEWHITSRTTGLIIAGSTGESATLDTDEQFDLIATVVKQVNHRIPVIAGTGTYCTRETIARTLAAKKAGADAALVVTPYYNKPTQKGLFEHYKEIAEKGELPIILYNVPGRTMCDLLPETIEQLAGIKNIIGIKEATGNIERAVEILKRCGHEFKVYSGDDATGLALMLKGGAGVISAVGNVVPEKMAKLCELALTGHSQEAEKINTLLLPLYQALFLETNPIAIKWALEEMGLITSGIRMPLLPLDKKFHHDVRKAMQIAGVI